MSHLLSVNCFSVKMRILWAVLAFSVFACNTKKHSFVIETDHTHDLKAGDSIYMKTVGIGTIEDIKLNDKYNVCLRMDIGKDFKIPEDSRFSICNTNLFSRGIEIIPGKSKTFLAFEDTVSQKIEIRNIPLDSIIEELANDFHRSLPSKR